MKTKEFIDGIKGINFKVKEERNYFEITDGSNNIYNVVAFVSKVETFKINTLYLAFEDLTSNDKKLLLDLLLEYSGTPIEEREEPKRYYIRNKHLADNQNHLILKSSGELVFDNVEDAFDSKFQFTIEELPKWVCQLLSHGFLVKEEVE